MNLTIILPCFNEESRLPHTLEHIYGYLRKHKVDAAEVFVVDDGSTDRTVQVARSWSDRLPIRVLQHQKNRGKGAALRTGVLDAKGDYVLLYDADGATPIEEVEKLFTAMKKTGANIAIGSRVIAGSHVAMKWHRRLIGRVYYWLTAPLIPGIRDAACGCKLLERSVAQDLFTRQKFNRFAYDPEILSMAITSGYAIAEVSVQWKAVPVSKVRLIRDGTEMFWRVLELYVRKYLRR
jgi:dolichyl-phosphate beta-glucosyltransferase